MKNNRNFGFTLVELAIVMVIIGLIAVGVLGTQSLIGSAKRQKTIDDISKYNTAFQAFRLEYDALPGDFNEAEAYWGASNTDNGNNNNSIDTNAESIDLWNHLGLAELVNGSFDHTASTLDTGTSAPYAESGATYSISNYCDLVTCTGTWNISAIGSNVIFIAGRDAVTISTEYGSNDEFHQHTTGLTNEEVKKIDNKIDDGNPIEGNFLAPACSTFTDHTTGDRTLDTSLSAVNLGDIADPYYLANTLPDCFFMNKF